MTEDERQIAQGIEGDMEQFELMCREWKECARTQVRYLLSTAREDTQAFNDGFAAGVTCVHAAVLDREYFVQHLPPDMSRPDEFYAEALVRDPDGIVVDADSPPTFASPQPEDWHGPSELPRLSRETMEQEMRKNIEKCDGWRAELASARQKLREALMSTDPAVFTSEQATAWLKVDRAHSQLSAVLKAMGAGNDFRPEDESTLTDSDRVVITPEFARTVLLRDPTVVVLQLDVLRSWVKILRDKSTLAPVGGVLDWFERIIQQREMVAGPPADESTTEGADQNEPTDGD